MLKYCPNINPIKSIRLEAYQMSIMKHTKWSIYQWLFSCPAWLFCAMQYPTGICLLLCAYLLYRRTTDFDTTILTFLVLMCISLTGALIGQLHQSVSLLYINIPVIRDFFGSNFTSTALFGGLLVQIVSIAGLVYAIIHVVCLKQKTTMWFETFRIIAFSHWLDNHNIGHAHFFAYTQVSWTFVENCAILMPR